MHQLQLLYTFLRPRWMLFLCLILVAYLARMALAQDAAVPEDAATPPAVSSEIELAPVESAVQPVEPIQETDPNQPVDAPVLPEPTQPIEVIVPSEPLLLPTTAPDIAISPTPIETLIVPDATLTTPILESTPVMVEPTLVDAATYTPDPLIEIQPTALPPEATLEDVPTQESSPVIPPADTPMLPSHLSGSIHSPLTGLEATVTISGAETQQTVAVQSDGSFTLEVLPGDYQLIITAQSHLPYILAISMTDQPVVLPTITLINTQMGSEIMRLIVQYFGLAVTLDSSAADVNGDNVINIYDLAIAGSSIR